jgi:hypothetical protein
MSTPREIADLVARFEQHTESYRSGNYNEAQLRKEFVDPMFKALGWDMDNISGYAEAYKDVIHEDAIKIGGATKAPDYCFRIGGTRKFFLEAKKPSVNIKDDVTPAFQLRRYAWSAKLPLSVLTDFEEFAVYDCRIKPTLGDSAAVARVLYLNFREYVSRWDEIEKIFSRDAILKGSFDKFAESKKAKRGTAQVDDAFLGEIENWRADLARNLASRNPQLSQRDLNFSVQRTIDRIVFLRICEDRRIEVYGRLQALLNGEHTYDRMRQLFRQADERYNSGLFHFQKEKNRIEPPDDLTPGLEIDDAILKKIIKRLYYPESPYEFSVLSADILGQVYEQFLGKVIRLTEGHQAKVEDKPEVKKAGGVYYTPTYIVDYIVKSTVGKLLEDKTPKQAAKLRILDPACGSGSFLIGAYQYLLDWHRDWFVNHEPRKRATGRAPVLYQASGGEWKLTTTERKRILLQNVFGVDIDAQAVETTKLSLLLKVLEGESEQSLATQLRFFHERALPDLGSNIKCGNSLIGTDFYEQQEMLFLDEEERYRINVFDWAGKDGFPEIMKAGGFDAVIGNPPYIRIQRISHEESDYLFHNYEAPTSKMDLSLVFLEKGLRITNTDGRIGFICTSQWLTTDYGKNLRRILKGGSLHSIVDFGSLPVFAKASTYPAIFILSPKPATSLCVRRITSVDQLSLSHIEAAAESCIELSTLTETPWNLGRLDLVKTLQRQKVPWKALRELGRAYIGCKTGMNEAFVISGSAATELKLEHAILFPYAYRGEEVSRYSVVTPDAFVIYPYGEGLNGSPSLIPEEELRRAYPNVYARLLGFKAQLRRRQDSRKLYASGPNWYRHLRAGSFRYIRQPKLAFKAIAKKTSGGLLRKNTAFDGANCPAIIGENFGQHDVNYVLGLLNSKLASYHLRGVCPPKLSGYLKYSARCLSETPIRIIDFSDRTDKARHDRVVESVERMLSLHKQLAPAKTAHEKTTIERQIDATDAQIDKLVYELYGLSADEIKIVEGAAK